MKNKFFFLTTTVILIIMFTLLSSKIIAAAHRAVNGKFVNPLRPLRLRRCDSYGCGHFGASRDAGRRKHKGQDYLCTKNEPVYAPISGEISTGSAYASGKYPDLRLVKITSGQTVVNLMYVSPAKTGRVEAGDIVGYAQSLHGVYAGIPDHIHVEVKIAGIHVDPAGYFEPENA